MLTVELGKDLVHHLRGGHPWVFRKALVRPPKAEAGEIVDIVSGGRFVARGLYDPHSPIAVRLLSHDPEEALGPELWKRRVAEAAALRRELLPIGPTGTTDGYRLIHGESDFLPGVVVDLYAGFAVLKLYSACWTPHRGALVEAIRAAVPGLRGVFGRDEVGREDSEEGDGKPSGGRVLWGEEPPARIAIREEGITLLVDVRRGQKTGLFLDQRENRAALRRFVPGRDVLNCFSYTGGFSVQAALGQARQVTSVDQDPDAIQLARENFSQNGLDPGKYEFKVGDVFGLLGQWKAQGRSFDVIVLDPPAFAKSQAKVPAALAGYASLNRAALQILRPGGYLATASCSARVSAEEFLGTVVEAAGKLGLALQLVLERYQPADHPILLQFPQGRYLKFFVFKCSGPAASARRPAEPSSSGDPHVSDVRTASRARMEVRLATTARRAAVPTPRASGSTARPARREQRPRARPKADALTRPTRTSASRSPPSSDRRKAAGGTLRRARPASAAVASAARSAMAARAITERTMATSRGARIVRAMSTPSAWSAGICSPARSAAMSAAWLAPTRPLKTTATSSGANSRRSA